jgi:dipeptidyl aminopeptidase/acylaminoacyl peptidase
MKYKILLIALIIVSALSSVSSQESIKYQMPPAEIVRIVDAEQTDGVSLSPDRSKIILIKRSGLITIEELSAEELRIAGLRIDPAVNGPSRQTFNKGYSIMNIDGTDTKKITGIPGDAKLGYPVWSPDGKKIAFTNTKQNSIELWTCNVETLTVDKIADGLNMIFGNSFNWLSDNRSILYYVTDPGRGNAPVRSRVPEGPVIQENYGKQGQVRTFQDLLKDQYDEKLFEYYAKSQLMLWNGSNSTKIGNPAIITDISPSPDGQYFTLTNIERPFSYIVTCYYFPSKTMIMDKNGNIVRTLRSLPLIENIPRGYDAVLPGPRSLSWRADKPATIYWVEALDNGDYTSEMQYHDQVYKLDAPFNGVPSKLIPIETRFSGITWGRDDYAIVSERLTRTRRAIVSSFDPSDPLKPVRKIQEYGYDDRYANPGTFMTGLNDFGRSVLIFADRGKSLFLTGAGASPEGDRPFIDKYNIASGTTTRLWRSEAPYFETVQSFIDISKNLLLTNRQSVTDVPNYFIRNLKNGRLTQITKFKNPYPQLAGITKELVRYKRNDGVELSFTLYLPANYDRQRNGPLPTLLWAYPREYIDPSSAGQISGSPYTFTVISPASALVYVTQGYAILMDAAFPIVKTGDKEPNDTYIEQLTANAEAAIDKAVELGVTDRKRVAVSGHSYGAFMTANLLANTRLFAAGIAESGAYNRTLTPFGFQSERRSYWDAPDIYNRMSPFMQADKVKDPLLLIHGIADNNDGTFPLQSERFYSALKGFGANVRLVMLPHESHGYAARETILHKHWEVLNWMNKYVRNNK